MTAVGPAFLATRGDGEWEVVMAKRTIRDIAWAGKRAIVRVDFNVPPDKNPGGLKNDRRIRGALPTVRALLEKPAAVHSTSHRARPDTPAT